MEAVKGPDGVTSSGNTFYVANENTSLLGSVSVERDRPVGKTSLLGAIFIVVNACIGAGMLNFPSAYQGAGGINIGIIMQSVLIVFVAGGLLILAQCSDVSYSGSYQEVLREMCGQIAQNACEITIIFYCFGSCVLILFIMGALLILAFCADIRLSPSYQDVIREMCGSTFRVMCEIAIIVYCFGTCITFLIIIGDQTDSILSFAMDNDLDHWYMSRKFTITMFAVFIILPMCLPKHIDFLKYPSSVGVLASLYVCAIIVVNYHIYPPSHNIVTKPASWTDVFGAVPAICFGFQCHVSSVPVYSSLKKRTFREFTKVVIGALIIAFTVYTLAGIYGGLTFGDKVCSDILLSYRNDDLPVTVARCMILCNMLTTYPVLHFCGRLAVESMWVTLWGLSSDQMERRVKPRRIIQTVCWFIPSLFLALFIPNIGVVISVIGGLAAVFILVFPGLCLIQFVLKHSAASIAKQRFLIFVGIAYTVLGVFILGESTTQSIMKDIQNGDQQAGQC